VNDVLEELDEQLEVVAGRKAPYSTVPDWVTLYPGKVLSPTAKAVYAVLAMHVNVSKRDGACWPSRKEIANILGFSREQSVDQYLEQLDAIDAIDREPVVRANGAKGVRYIVHQTPPPVFDGDHNIGEYYKRRRVELAEERTRKPGRPRKTTAPVAEPAAPEAAPAETTEEQPSAPRKAPAKKTAAKKAPAQKAEPKELTPEQQALKELTDAAVDSWWKEAERLVAAKKMGPLLGSPKAKSGYFLNLRTRIQEAFEAGYDRYAVWHALHAVGEWSPAKREFDRALRAAAGIHIPGQRRNGPTPLFRNEQWRQDKPQDSAPDAPEPAARPSLDAFGIDVQPA
jgi:hypothetical protein